MPRVPANGAKVWTKRRPARFDLAGRASLWESSRAVLLVACWVSVGFAACSKSSDRSPAISIEHDLSPKPARIGQTLITLRLTDVSGRAVPGAHVAIEGDMSHPGMSPVFGEAKEVETGRYQGSIDLAMAGDWVVLVHVTLADGLRMERQFDVSGVRAN
jgi:hypothetical protein